MGMTKEYAVVKLGESETEQWTVKLKKPSNQKKRGHTMAAQ
jgi:hypothetical protein